VAAARAAAHAGRIESRRPLARPLDVLAQHLVTVALGGGFTPDELLREVRTTHAYADLSETEWAWTLDFAVRGGDALQAYPEFRRIAADESGVYRVANAALARRHRMSVGTIVGDAAVAVRYLKGPRLGTVEESFIARLRPGDRFVFAGKTLELVRVRDLTAWVRKATRPLGTVPRWMGGRMPLSSELAESVRDLLSAARDGRFDEPEMAAVRPILACQAAWSRIPARDELLVERIHTREGHHIYIYPFEGRLVHEGLAALTAYRLSRLRPISFTLAVNDYGFELLSPEPAPLDDALRAGLLSPDGLADDLPASLNAAELAKRGFREIARVAGLVFPGLPGAGKTAKQLQASAGLYFDVFTNYDPDNLLLHQAHREVRERQLEESRLRLALKRLSASRWIVVEPRRPTPLAFPLLVERLRESLSSETLAERVRKMQLQLETEPPG
jgi:ATP-dependent Lhr-like helicase